MKRLFKPLMILTPLAVFCSLQFSGPNGEPINSVLDPLLPAKANADLPCHPNAKCEQITAGVKACVTFQYSACVEDHEGDCIDVGSC